MPTRANRPCLVPGCAGFVVAGGKGRCATHAQDYFRTREATRRSYGSRGSGHRWQHLRQHVLAREPLCRSCYARGRVQLADEVDHILPLARGGTNDVTNLQALCVACHRAKTTAELADERRGATS